VGVAEALLAGDAEEACDTAEPLVIAAHEGWVLACSRGGAKSECNLECIAASGQSAEAAERRPRLTAHEPKWSGQRG
jgi:hypothetical protein